MKRTQQLSFLSIFVFGAVFGIISCGGATGIPPTEDATLDASVETVSLKIEGMT